MSLALIMLGVFLGGLAMELFSSQSPEKVQSSIMDRLRTDIAVRTLRLLCILNGFYLSVPSC